MNLLPISPMIETVTAAHSMQRKEAMNTSSSPIHNICPHSHMIAGYSIFLFGISIMVWTANLEQTSPTDQQTLLMLAGALIASSTAFLANRTVETIKVVMARALFSCVTGIAGPLLGAYYLTWVKDLLNYGGVMQFGASFAVGLVAFIISLPLIRSGFNRADGAANRILNHWESRYLPKPEQIDEAKIKTASSNLDDK